MLSSTKFLKGLGNLNLRYFKSYRLRNNIDHLTLFSCSFNLTHCNLYSVIANEDKRIPLNEISNIKLPLNYNEENMLKIINEIQYAKSKGKMIPEYMKLSEIDDLLNCETLTQRQKFLTFLFKKEQKKLKDAEKSLQKWLDNKNKNTVNATNSGHIEYGLGKNTLLLKTWRRSIMSFYEKRLARSALFGQRIVIDLSYDVYMSRKEKRACAAQLRLLYSRNRYNTDPYDLYFCNADPKSKCMEYLHQEMPTTNSSLQTLYEQSYLDLFSKEDLVYLSPHASETLKTYDHKAVYIIGGFVDTVKRFQISERKAEKEGIKSYSLPLNEYVLWGCGSKSLSIDQVFSIMQTMRDTGDWKEAFKYVPTRKLRRVQTDSEESQLISDKLFVLSN